MDMKDVIKARERLMVKMIKDIQAFEESTGVVIDGVQLVRPLLVSDIGSSGVVMSLTGIKLDVTF